MPFSYDVDPTQSSRANRRRHTQESKSLDNEVIDTKALGARISDIRYDPNAIDGDGDGLVQEGSPYERPAVLSNVAGLVRGLSSRSSTGDHGFTSEGSWTKGLTNDEIAERVVPDSPAKAVEAISASIGSTNAIWTLDGAMNSVTEVMEGGVDGLIFDEKKIEELRKVVSQALDESPLFRDAVDKFGIPPILIGKFNKDSSGATAMMHDSVVMTVADSNLDSIFKRGVFDTVGQRVGKIFSPGINFKGTKRHTVGSSTEDTIRHEWGHYLNALVSNLHPDAEQRELSDNLRLDSWYDVFGQRKDIPLIGGLNAFMDDVHRQGTFDFDPPSDDIPWINTAYGQTSPVEFFAEAVSAYFSPDKKKRALLNEAGSRVVERMLGTQDTPIGGLSSRNVHSQDLNKLSNVEIAELVVPDSPEVLEALMNELNDIRGGSETSIDDGLMESFGATDVVDFHPVRVAQMREHVANMLEANPQFKKSVQAYGMPPVAFASPDYKWDVFDTPPQACYSTNGAPIILFNPNAFDKAEEYDNWMEAPSRNFFEKIKKRLSVADANTTGNEGLPETTRMAVGTDHNATLVHEWSHYIHDLAMFIHPDEQTRNDLSFFWNKDWDSAQELGEALDLMPDGKSQLFDLTGDIKDAIDNGDPLPDTAPFVRTWYGQSSPVEMFAEGLTAYIHGNGEYRDLNSQRMNKIIERMFNPPSGDEVIDKLTADTSRATSGLSSRTVKRDENGVRDPSDSFNALSGANWLKDATDEEIADAVVPMNAEDMVEMAMHTGMWGNPGTADFMKVLTSRLELKDILVNETKGKVFIDFSPEGREKAKKIVLDALKESPEFAWAVRNFGLPPVIVTDGKAVHEFLSNGGQVSDMFDALHPSDSGYHGTMGWSTGSFFIALNMAADMMQQDRPSGYLPKSGMRATDVNDEPYIRNFGYSRADTLRHEFGHYLWMSMSMNFFKKDGTNDRQQKNLIRQEKAAYFFPHLSSQEGQARIRELKRTFNAGALILSSDASQRAQLSALITNSGIDPRAKDSINQLIDVLAIHPEIWSPTLTGQVQEIMQSVDPSYPPLPMLRGEYALFNRQELWAEAVSLFFSPDKGMRNRYMSDELRGFVARALGLQVDANGKHERPWNKSNGLSSRVESVSKRTITTADNFSSKPTGPSRRDFNPLPEAVITQNSPSLITMSLGDDKWILDTGDDNPSLWNLASEAWSTEEGHDSMRLISASLMGLGTMGDNERNSGVIGSIMDGRTSTGDVGVRDEVREMAQHTYSGLYTVHAGDNITDTPHSRVLENVGPESSLMTTDINSDITLPLTSFGDESRTREVLTTPSNTPRTLVTLNNGAQVALLKDDEVVTAGLFRVVRRDTTEDGITRIELEHRSTFDPSQGRVVPLRSRDTSGLASSSAPLRRAESGLPEKAQEKFQADIDAKRTEIEELNDINRRLRLAMEELQETGSWQGEKYNIRINDQGVKPPVTATREEIEAQAIKNGLTLDEEIAEYVKDIESAGRNRRADIDRLEKEVTKLEETKDFITKDKPDNTFHIEELLADPALAEELRRRSAEVNALSYRDRATRFTDPNDPDAVYVLHWGASELIDGMIDPSRSRGQVGAGIQGNTRQINDETARFMVGKRDDAKRDISILEDIKRLAEENNGVIDFNEVAKTDPKDSLRAGRARMLLGVSRSDRDIPTRTVGESGISDIEGLIQDRNRTLSRLDKVADQLIADDYQYSSTYRASGLQDLFSSYGGRYAQEGTDEWGNSVGKAPSTGIHIFRVKIGDDATEENSVGETHLVGKHTPIASLVADNDPDPKNPASSTWAGWVDMAIQQDIQSRRDSGPAPLNAKQAITSIQERVGGLSSRGIPTNPAGKSVEEIAKEIELSPAEVEILEQVLPDVPQLEKIEVSPSLEGQKQELIDSVRISVGEDGIPFIYAKPHPLLSEEIPDDRDWSTVVRPSKETLKRVKELIDRLVKKSMGEDTPEEFWTRSTNDGDKAKISEAFRGESTRLKKEFSAWAASLLDEIIKTKQGPTSPQPEGLSPDENGTSPWLRIWAEGLRDLGSPIVRPFDDNDLNSHDSWGHLGTGRGFDRHGEWANMLAMFSLMDRWAEENNVSKDELLNLKAGWFQTFEFNRVDGEFKPLRDEIRQEDKWYIKQWAIDSAIDFADTAELEELITLLDDGNTHNASSSRGLSSSSKGVKAEIVKNDIVRQTVLKNTETTSGLSSRQSRSAKKLAKKFRPEGSPRPKPATRRELIDRGVPTNASQLADILEKSPFSKGKDREHILDMIDRMEVDWDAQAKLSQKLEKVLADSAGFEELLGEYDIPMMLVTKWGAVRDEVWGGDRKRLGLSRWDNIEGEYHPEFGIITFPERIVNRDYITNSVTDGQLSTEDVIRHELSHTIHAMAMSRSKKARKAYEKDTEQMVKTLEDAIKKAKDAGLAEINLSSIKVLPDEDHTAAGMISRYAQTKRSEYIAELLTHMLPGKNTKPVILLESHYLMLSEFLDIPVARLKEIASKSANSKVPWL